MHINNVRNVEKDKLIAARAVDLYVNLLDTGARIRGASKLLILLSTLHKEFPVFAEMVELPHIGTSPHLFGVSVDLICPAVSIFEEAYRDRIINDIVALRLPLREEINMRAREALILAEAKEVGIHEHLRKVDTLVEVALKSREYL